MTLIGMCETTVRLFLSHPTGHILMINVNMVNKNMTSIYMYWFYFMSNWLNKYTKTTE